MCQQRKVKCDRKFPCANCARARVQCMPASPIQRRRRFPERELLERLRHYEGLLRQHNIKFNPLHGDTPAAKGDPPKARAGVATGASKGEPLYEAKYARVLLERIKESFIVIRDGWLTNPQEHLGRHEPKDTTRS